MTRTRSVAAVPVVLIGGLGILSTHARRLNPPNFDDDNHENTGGDQEFASDELRNDYSDLPGFENFLEEHGSGDEHAAKSGDIDDHVTGQHAIISQPNAKSEDYAPVNDHDAGEDSEQQHDQHEDDEEDGADSQLDLGEALEDMSNRIRTIGEQVVAVEDDLKTELNLIHSKKGKTSKQTKSSSESKDAKSGASSNLETKLSVQERLVVSQQRAFQNMLTVKSKELDFVKAQLEEAEGDIGLLKEYVDAQQEVDGDEDGSEEGADKSKQEQNSAKPTPPTSELELLADAIKKTDREDGEEILNGLQESLDQIKQHLTTVTEEVSELESDMNQQKEMVGDAVAEDGEEDSGEKQEKSNDKKVTNNKNSSKTTVDKNAPASDLEVQDETSFVEDLENDERDYAKRIDDRTEQLDEIRKNTADVVDDLGHLMDALQEEVDENSQPADAMPSDKSRARPNGSAAQGKIETESSFLELGSNEEVPSATRSILLPDEPEAPGRETDFSRHSNAQQQQFQSSNSQNSNNDDSNPSIISKVLNTGIMPLTILKSIFLQEQTYSGGSVQHYHAPGTNDEQSLESGDLNQGLEKPDMSVPVEENDFNRIHESPSVQALLAKNAPATEIEAEVGRIKHDIEKAKRLRHGQEFMDHDGKHKYWNKLAWHFSKRHEDFGDLTPGERVEAAKQEVWCKEGDKVQVTFPGVILDKHGWDNDPRKQLVIHKRTNFNDQAQLIGANIHNHAEKFFPWEVSKADELGNLQPCGKLPMQKPLSYRAQPIPCDVAVTCTRCLDVITQDVTILLHACGFEKLALRVNRLLLDIQYLVHYWLSGPPYDNQFVNYSCLTVCVTGLCASGWCNNVDEILYDHADRGSSWLGDKFEDIRVMFHYPWCPDWLCGIHPSAIHSAKLGGGEHTKLPAVPPPPKSHPWDQERYHLEKASAGSESIPLGGPDGATHIVSSSGTVIHKIGSEIDFKSGKTGLAPATNQAPAVKVNPSVPNPTDGTKKNFAGNSEYGTCSALTDGFLTKCCSSCLSVETKLKLVKNCAGRLDGCCGSLTRWYNGRSSLATKICFLLFALIIVFFVLQRIFTFSMKKLGMGGGRKSSVPTGWAEDSDDEDYEPQYMTADAPAGGLTGRNSASVNVGLPGGKPEPGFSRSFWAGEDIADDEDYSGEPEPRITGNSDLDRAGHAGLNQDDGRSFIDLRGERQ